MQHPLLASTRRKKILFLHPSLSQFPRDQNVVQKVVPSFSVSKSTHCLCLKLSNDNCLDNSCPGIQRPPKHLACRVTIFGGVRVQMSDLVGALVRWDADIHLIIQPANMVREQDVARL